MDSNKIIAQISDLHVINKDNKEIISGVDFILHKGETLGIVGESGSGKTITLKAIAGLLPDGISISEGSVSLNGRYAMIFQNPVSSLDPLCGVFNQLLEVIKARQGLDKAEAKKVGIELLGRLSLPMELSSRDRFPYELSGGQCQRILIAMALACKMDVLFCDEPTTALDVTVQKKTLDLIKELQKEMGFSIIFVTHNLAVASNICDRLCVMKKGSIVEQGPSMEIINNPKEEYTKTLLKAVLYCTNT